MSSYPHVACVEIGAVPVALSTEDQGFLDLLRKRYDGFLSSSAPDFRLEFEVAPPGPTEDEDLVVRREGEEWLVRRGDFFARLNTVERSGKVRQNSNPYSLDSVLRILHSLILAERGGFLLHAASAICDGRAFLFSGLSGAGKTTISRLAPSGVTLLTDEISYIRPSASGYDAFGTPFSGELAKSGENCSAPIAGLFLLAQGAENRFDQLPGEETMRRLMRNILFFAEDRILVEKLFATAFDFVARVPVRQLTFYPDAKVWEKIRNFEEASQYV